MASFEHPSSVNSKPRFQNVDNNLLKIIPMKITHLTSLHRFNDIRIFHKECKSLALHGYDVSLIAKAGKDELIDGIKIIAINEQTNRLKRFFISSIDVYQKAISIKATIFHFHDPELIPIGVLLSLQGKKVIYDVHEDLPRQILSKAWISPFLRYPVSFFAGFTEWIASRFFFSGIVPATPKIAARFPSSKVALVQNYPKLDELTSAQDKPWLSRKTQITYIGSIDETRGVIENINALELLTNNDIRMVMAGPFSSKALELKCKRLEGWKRIDYHAWLSRNELMRELGQSIAGLVILHPTPAYIDSLPIKMFEYMLAGIPVIASDFPLWRKIINANNCGVLVDPLNPIETANAVNWIVEHPEEAERMGQNGRKAVVQNYNWSMEEKKLLDFYKRLHHEEYYCS